MRLAVSNIAWDVAEDEQVASLLQKYQVDAIDIAPGKYFPQPDRVADEDIFKVKDWWADRGIEITGMQALLFGTNGLNVFGSSEIQEKLLDHLGAVCSIAGKLGAPRIVFGSPRNRDRQGLDDEETLTVASAFFRRLGDIAQSNGVFICLEPNPVVYGANFMTTAEETESVVRAVSHPAIRMQFDTGAVLINGEDPHRVLEKAADVIGHIHLSEPALAPLGDSGQDHRPLASAIHRFFPSGVMTIEMVATQNEDHLVSLERALRFAGEYYRGATMQAPA